jgi:hypothetical protein
VLANTSLSVLRVVRELDALVAVRDCPAMCVSDTRLRGPTLPMFAFPFAGQSAADPLAWVIGKLDQDIGCEQWRAVKEAAESHPVSETAVDGLGRPCASCITDGAKMAYPCTMPPGISGRRSAPPQGEHDQCENEAASVSLPVRVRKGSARLVVRV